MTQRAIDLYRDELVGRGIAQEQIDELLGLMLKGERTLDVTPHMPGVVFPGPERGRGGVDRVPLPERGGLTVAQAHDILWKEIWEGPTTCLCCQRKASIRLQGLNAKMAEFLWVLVKEQYPNPEPQYQGGTLGDAVYLRHWGLIRRFKNDVYAATADGIAYVMGGLHAVPSQVLLYDNRLVLGWSEKLITIDEARGKVSVGE